MAQRRMLSKKIVDTDAFLDMGAGSQLLYFHLVMRADDDGFVANPKKIMRMLGSQIDDYKVLIAKRFIITFENGICVIKHWLIHNLIRRDRYIETQWHKEKELLIIKKPTNKYSLNSGKKENVIPNDNHWLPQVRLGKVSIDNLEDKSSEEPIKIIEEFSSKEYIKSLINNKRKDLHIIGIFWKHKEKKFDNKEQVSSQLKRHLKSANNLKGYSDEQILAVFDEIDKESDYDKKYVWSLETIHKRLGNK